MPAWKPNSRSASCRIRTRPPPLLQLPVSPRWRIKVWSLPLPPTDPEGDTPLFSIVGGADEAFFHWLNQWAVVFASAPNFESPEDANLDNLYEVQVQAIDPSGLLVTQSLTVQVTNANEVPVISSGPSLVGGEWNRSDHPDCQRPGCRRYHYLFN